jgi:hypothetical protein
MRIGLKANMQRRGRTLPIRRLESFRRERVSAL